MSELVLPGVFIEVRDEGLIVPPGVTVGNVGMIGTASKGPIGKPVILGSFPEARARFGEPDPWIDGKNDELTLVRGLEQAFRHGATTVIAVRVAKAGAAKAATYALKKGTDTVVTLTAKTEGTWGNDLEINVTDADEHAFIEDEAHDFPGTTKLDHGNVINSARNRVRLFTPADGLTRSLEIVYTGTPTSGQVKIDPTTGDLSFDAAPPAGAELTASYVVSKTAAVKVTLRLGTAREVYTVVSGNDLEADVKRLSAWVDAKADGTHGGKLPDKSASADLFAVFGTGSNVKGENGAVGADYNAGLDALLNEPVHILVAAGQNESFGDELAAHCELASSDDVKRDRIALVGSDLGTSIDDLLGHTLNSPRLIYAAPGIKANDSAASPPAEVTLSAAYTAAALAGRLAGFAPHISLTNKVLNVGGLEKKYTQAELKQLVLARVLALEERDGFRVVKGITTSTNTAWHQITTRRIVDFAKFGVRAAANPFIGRLNNDRVRGALRTAINGFLAEMVADEKLVSYELAVTATRDQEIRGIVEVTMTLLPTFSIDFIKVTMFLG